MCRRLALLMLLCVSLPGHGQEAKPSEQAIHAARWPLRVHVLAIDETHRTVRMQPNWSSGSVPDASGEMPASSSGGGSSTLGGGNDDFSGTGRADLVTPPDATAGLKFTYEGCNRVRVAPGFQALEARWTKPGARLEVLIPAEAVKDGATRMARCTLKVTMQEFVYLRMPNGAIVRVSQEAYAKKPSLRAFLSGGTETLKRRAPRTADAP